MAKGDVRSDFQVLASGATMLISATTGEEWVIHNIYHEDSVVLGWATTADFFEWDDVPGRGDYAGMQFHVTPTRFIRVRELTGTSKKAGFDGVQTK